MRRVAVPDSSFVNNGANLGLPSYGSLIAAVPSIWEKLNSFLDRRDLDDTRPRNGEAAHVVLVIHKCCLLWPTHTSQSISNEVLRAI